MLKTEEKKKPATKKEIRNYLLQRMMDNDMRRLMYTSSALIAVSKGLAIASPWFLKGVVDMMSLGGPLTFGGLAFGICGFSIARLGSTVSQEYRSIMVADFIQRGIRTISQEAFNHLHNLDLNYHKTSSKNTVFGINRAVRSIESALRFTLGFATPIVVEFSLLCFMVGFYLGPVYLTNMLITLGCYAYYSKIISESRRVQIRERKNADKKQEFTLNESIMNYETVKTFTNEKFES